MKLSWAAVAAIGGALVVSGCAGTSQPGSSTPASTRSPTPTAVPTATPKQFASIIAEDETTLRNYYGSIVDCALADVSKDMASSIKVLTCRTTAQTVTLDAQNMLRDIGKLPKPDPEVSSLVDRTINVLTPLAAINASLKCKDIQSADCDAAETAVNGAIRNVIPVLDAWKPYMQ